VVWRDGDRLMGRAVQEKNPTEWKAESDTHFYVLAADVEIDFVKDTSDKFTLLFDGSAKAERVAVKNGWRRHNKVNATLVAPPLPNAQG